MTTVAKILDRAQRQLLVGTREQVNILTSSVTDVATTWTFTYDLRGIQVGSVLNVDTEDVYVVAVSGATATLIRGYAGSTAAAHSASAQVTVNPKWSKATLFDQVNNELDALSAEGLYKMNTVDLTYNPSKNGYDLTSVTSLEDVYAVYADQSGTLNEWPRIPRDMYDFRRNQSTTDFASTNALVLKDPSYAQSGFTVRVLYKSPFTLATATTDDVTTTCGLPATAVDLLIMGAAIRMVWPREVARNTFETQGDTRRAGEVSPGANLGAARGWDQLRMRRLGEEVLRLEAHYPEFVDR